MCVCVMCPISHFIGLAVPKHDAPFWLVRSGISIDNCVGEISPLYM